jgi:hypothetical protein
MRRSRVRSGIVSSRGGSHPLDGGLRSGNPAVFGARRGGLHQTGGFASPPRGGFALESGCSKTQSASTGKASLPADNVVDACHDKVTLPEKCNVTRVAAYRALLGHELKLNFDVEIGELAGDGGAESERGVLDR